MLVNFRLPEGLGQTLLCIVTVFFNKLLKKMAALHILFGRRAMRRERVFRDRNNSMDYMTDMELVQRFRFTRHSTILVVSFIVRYFVKLVLHLRLVVSMILDLGLFVKLTPGSYNVLLTKILIGVFGGTFAESNEWFQEMIKSCRSPNNIL
jgi:hypothetical protein